MRINKRILLSCAFRYALGRKTYVVGAIVDEIKKNWKDLPKAQKWIYHKEIKEAIENNEAGMTCDVEKWKEILELK